MDYDDFLSLTTDVTRRSNERATADALANGEPIEEARPNLPTVLALNSELFREFLEKIPKPEESMKLHDVLKLIDHALLLSALWTNFASRLADDENFNTAEVRTVFGLPTEEQRD